MIIFCHRVLQVRNDHQTTDEGVLHKIERVDWQQTESPVFGIVVREKKHKAHEREVGKECRAYVLSSQYD